jgi:DNA-binding NarL/FixJ family response regulator
VDSGSTATVVICDDVAEMRKLLRETIEDDDGLRVVGEADNGLDAVRVTVEMTPDVVIMDLSMPEMDGLEAIELIARESPSTGIVVLSGFGADVMRDVALARGAHRYVEKGDALDALFTAVHEVARTNSRVQAQF